MLPTLIKVSFVNVDKLSETKSGTVSPFPSRMKNMPSVRIPPIAKVIDPQIAGPVQYLKTRKKFNERNMAADALTSKTSHP